MATKNPRQTIGSNSLTVLYFIRLEIEPQEWFCMSNIPVVPAGIIEHESEVVHLAILPYIVYFVGRFPEV
jgi:hypothetical protein